MTTDRDPQYRQALLTAGYTVLGLVVVVLLWALRDVLVLVGFAALLAFALEPGVVWLTSLRFPRGRISRRFASALLMLVIVGLTTLALFRVVPQLVAELSGFVDRAPENLERLMDWLRAQAAARGWSADDLRAPDLTSLLRTAGGAVLSTVVGALGNWSAIVGLVLMPILAFYLLTERGAVEGSTLDFVPEGARPRIRQALRAMAVALRSYVRGQALICATVGVLGWLAFWALGLPVSALLGVVVGLAEVIPILGFWVASIAIVLTGWSVSPAVAAWAFIVYMALNQLVAMFVTPRVLGQQMRMHPFVVTVSILSGAALLGAAGAILALPVAAAVQSLMAEFARGGRSRPVR